MTIPENRIPWLILRLAPQMTRTRFCVLIDHFQGPEPALGASAKEIASLRGFNDDLARGILEAPRTVACDKEIALMDKHGVRLLAVDDEEYPENLRQSSFPPPLLYVRGRLEPRDRYSVAIIGSRRATQYGRAVAQQFAARLAGCGITIASGFARGIDSQAHQSSMDAGGRTVGVLGNGHAVCYPPENQKLGQRIVEQGALVSEYPMETPPDRFNFPERNHVIAAISLGTVVAEAAEKSGALITANQAVEENRFVFAVPGDITRLNSRGTNALIHAGARLVQRPEDILLEMRHLLRGYLRDEDLAETARLPDAQALTVAGSAPAPHQAQGNLSEDEQAVLELIRHEPQYFDALLAKLDPARFTVQKLSTVLLSLELKQAVKQMPGRLYLSLRA